MGDLMPKTGTLPENAQFVTTHWSVVLAAVDTDSDRAAEALDKLCRAYWHPLYVYVRRLGHGHEQARDLTQEFFARLLEKRFLDAVDPEKGKFRSFLLTALKRFMANEWDRTQRLKRGGDCVILPFEGFQFDEDVNGACHLPEPADDETPEKAFERRWAITLLDRVLDRLEKDSAAGGKSELFAALKPFVTGEDERGAYLEAATALKMTEGASRVAVHRLRQRYRELLRFEIAQTVSQPELIDDEIRSLFAAVTK